MNNVDALKTLYVAMGGDADTVAGISTNAEMILAIADLIGSGSTATLPAVTATDNGKVLKVANGVWTAANA